MLFRTGKDQQLYLQLWQLELQDQNQEDRYVLN